MDKEPISIISNEFPRVAISLIESARESIDIIVFDWRFYNDDPANSVSQFNHAIYTAVKRGVSVRCLVNSESVIDNLKKMGCYAKCLYSKKLLHTKLLIVDKRRIILGSHNYTQQAFCSNHELSVGFVLDNCENNFIKYFNNLFGL